MRLRVLSRSPSTYWVAVGGLALVTTLAVSGLLGRARSEAARYGSAKPVLVATRDIAAGAPVGASDVEIRSLPASLVPSDAMGGVDQARGRVVVVPVFAGQAVVRRQLAPFGLTGAAALLPAGKQGISVSAGPAAAKLSKGDTVDVLATFDPATAPGKEPTFPVAVASLVIDVGSDAVTIAVDPEEAKRVAFAIAHGAVTVVLSSPVR
ncbi:MAG: flagella basal body P-ring formation protein FlgA [Acidimicrobiia bacterium]|nr:flagella basal body P-ring formation protein FlgA [Acidimicrobiia bacterium]